MHASTLVTHWQSFFFVDNNGGDNDDENGDGDETFDANDADKKNIEF